MASAVVHIGTTNFATTITTGGRTLTVDEPASRGGGGAGFEPYELLLASLGACTAITLRMYAIRKQWDLEAVDVRLRHTMAEKRSHIARVLVLKGALTEEQKTRLAEIAERTPVTLTLKDGADIVTRVEET